MELLCLTSALFSKLDDVGVRSCCSYQTNKPSETPTGCCAMQCPFWTIRMNTTYMEWSSEFEFKFSATNLASISKIDGNIHGKVSGKMYCDLDADNNPCCFRSSTTWLCEQVGFTKQNLTVANALKITLANARSRTKKAFKRLGKFLAGQQRLSC